MTNQRPGAGADPADLIGIGFYREFPGSTGDEPVLRDEINQGDPSDQARLLHYLRSGIPIVQFKTLAHDVIDPAHPILGPLEFRSDGVYLWRSDFAHYVERYRVRIPKTFTAHAENAGWQVPDEEELTDI